MVDIVEEELDGGLEGEAEEGRGFEGVGGFGGRLGLDLEDHSRRRRGVDCRKAALLSDCGACAARDLRWTRVHDCGVVAVQPQWRASSAPSRRSTFYPQPSWLPCSSSVVSMLGMVITLATRHIYNPLDDYVLRPSKFNFTGFSC